MKDTLIIRDLRAGIEGREILRGINLTVRKGEIHAIMGPNGSGKSTLGLVVMGHPSYEVYGGEVIFNNRNLLDMEPHERAQAGLFLAFQHPLEIDGVRFSTLLWQAYSHRFGNGRKPDIIKFRKELRQWLRNLGLPEDMADRYINVGFSGGEKKRAEIVQMAILKPEIAILDEIDSGLDIDAVRIVAENVKRIKEETGMGVILITHYQRILNYIVPDYVHVMVNGRIVEEGGPELAEALEREGYARYGVKEEA